MQPRFPRPRVKVRENVNEAIRAREVRAVFPDGVVEIMPTQQAIRRAREMGLDLILVAPTAEPPVAKAMDYGQWQYEQKKKQQEAKKKQHVIQVKELKFRPNTDDHDYNFKLKHAIRFLTEGNRVKAVVQFRGREISHAELGKNLLMRLASDLAQYATVEGQPRLEGRLAHIILSPKREVIQKKEKEKQKGREEESRATAEAASTGHEEEPLATEEETAPDTALGGAAGVEGEETPALEDEAAEFGPPSGER